MLFNFSVRSADINTGLIYDIPLIMVFIVINRDLKVFNALKVPKVL